MRVSDTDRQRVIDELRRHCAAGRLDVDEYAGRVEQALDATTLEQLDGVLADLPMMRIADPAALSRPGAWANGGEPAGRGQLVPAGPVRRGAAATVVVLSVVVVVGVVLLDVLASWSWVAVLLAGWVIGLAQAGLAGRRRNRS